MGTIFHVVFFQPLYNALVWLTDVLPGGDVGLAVIILTVVVRLILFPLQHKMTHTQRKMKELDGEIKAIKDQYAKNPQEQAQALMALYKEHGISPFSGFLLLLIQLPILWALYRVFRGGIVADPASLYSFVAAPLAVNPLFFGLINLSAHSLVLSLVAGAAQYLQVNLAMPALASTKDGTDFQSQLARSMSLQMKFIFPAMIVLVSWSLPSVMALYWITTSLFSVGHELLVRRQARSLSLKTKTTN